MSKRPRTDIREFEKKWIEPGKATEHKLLAKKEEPTEQDLTEAEVHRIRQLEKKVEAVEDSLLQLRDFIQKNKALFSQTLLNLPQALAAAGELYRACQSIAPNVDELDAFEVARQDEGEGDPAKYKLDDAE